MTVSVPVLLGVSLYSYFTFTEKFDKQNSLQLRFKAESKDISIICIFCTVVMPVISVTSVLKGSDIQFYLILIVSGCRFDLYG